MLNSSSLNTRAINASAAGTPSLLVEILQGATVVATRTLTGFTSTVTPTNIVLTSGELALVTDPNTLTVRFTHQGGGIIQITSAAITLTGTVSGTFFYQALAATLAITAALTDQIRRALAASVTGAGSLIKQPRRTLSAALTAAGTVVEQTRRTLTASMTLTTTLGAIKAILRTLAAASTLTGALARQTRRTFAAAVTATTTVIRQSTRTLSATLTGTATITRRTARSVAATLTLTAAVSTLRALARTVGGSLTATTGLLATKSFLRTLSAAVTATATLTPLKSLLRAVTATLTPTTAVQEQVHARRAAEVTLMAGLVQRLARTVSRSMAAAGSLVKQPRRALSAALILTATVLRQKVVLRAVSAALTLTATVQGRAQTLRAASSALATSLWQRTAHGVGATLPVSGARFVEVPRRLAGSLTVSAVTLAQKAAQVTMEAALLVTAGVSRLPQLLRQATIAILGVLDLLNEWSGLIRATATVSQRYDGTVSLVIRPATSQLRQQAATVQAQLLPGTAQVQPLPSTGQATPLPGTGTLQS